MTEKTHHTVYRKEYTPPDYSVDSIDLRFELGDETTLVTSRMSFRLQYDASQGTRPLVLNGKQLVLRELILDGTPLAPELYTVTADLLTIHVVPSQFILEIMTETSPSGEYRAGGAIPLEWHVLHPVRGGGVPGHHLVSGPP